MKTFDHKGIFYKRLLDAIGDNEAMFVAAGEAWRYLHMLSLNSNLSLDELSVPLNGALIGVRRWAEKHSICPKCGGDLTIMDVNNIPSKMVGGGYTKLIFCNNQNKGFCDFERYIKKFKEPAKMDLYESKDPETQHRVEKPCRGCKEKQDG